MSWREGRRCRPLCADDTIVYHCLVPRMRFQAKPISRTREPVFIRDDIIIIGEADSPNVASVAWDESRFPNLAEYKLVIADLSSLYRKLFEPALADFIRRKSTDKRKQVNGRLELVTTQMLKVLNAGGDVIVIGDQLSYTAGDHFPYTLPLTTDSGTRLEYRNERLIPYFEYCGDWRGTFDPRSDVAEWARQVYYFLDDDDFSVHLEELANTTYGESVAFGLYWFYRGKWSGRFTRLPKPTEIEVPQAMNVLASLFQIGTQASPEEAEVEAETSIGYQVAVPPGGGLPDVGRRTEQASAASNAEAIAADQRLPEANRVMVVHGRNAKLREDLFSLLVALGVEPLEWSQAVALTGKAAPYVGEVLDAAFSAARAVVVLLSGDDVAYLREDLQDESDPPFEKLPTPQSRPNVLFEAGMALAVHPNRTVFLQVGDVRPFSDLGGRHTIRAAGQHWRRDFADRLVVAGCDIDRSGDSWETMGEFFPGNVGAADERGA